MHVALDTRVRLRYGAALVHLLALHSMTCPSAQPPLAPEPELPGALVPLAVPPELAEAFGYTGSARFVGFHWSPCGDDLVWDDGRDSGSGHGWAFLTFKRHRAVAPLLSAADFGTSETDGTDRLILDRVTNRAAVASAATTRAFLSAQHPTVLGLPACDFVAVRAAIRAALDEQRAAPFDPGAVERLLDARRARLVQMVAFLDACAVPAVGPAP